ETNQRGQDADEKARQGLRRVQLARHRYRPVLRTLRQKEDAAAAGEPDSHCPAVPRLSGADAQAARAPGLSSSPCPGRDTVGSREDESMKRQSSVHVGFRMPPQLADELKQRGAKHGLSPGEYGRLLVVEALERGEESEVSAVLAALRSEIHALREDVA